MKVFHNQSEAVFYLFYFFMGAHRQKQNNYVPTNIVMLEFTKKNK